MIVAASRVHVRIHYASDVIGGIAIGALLGELARKLVPVEEWRPESLSRAGR